MSNEKFTKEKWIFIESNNSIVANGNNIAFTGMPRTVSEIRNDGESWLEMRHRTDPERAFVAEEQKANGRLICAAPDLFHACQKVDTLYSEIERMVDGEVLEMLNIVRDALKKAVS